MTHSTSSSACRPCLPPSNSLLDHVLIDGDDAGAARGRVEFEIANHAPERLAQCASAEAFLAGGVPGDGDERAARDLQIDPELLKVSARGAKDGSVGLDENFRQVRLGEVVEDNNRFEARDELRRHAVTKEILIFQIVPQMKRQLLTHFA